MKLIKRWFAALLRLFTPPPHPPTPTVPLQNKDGTFSIAPVDNAGQTISARNARRLERKAARKKAAR